MPTYFSPEEALRLIHELGANGRLFSVRFHKKTNPCKTSMPEERTMCCRLGIPPAFPIQTPSNYDPDRRSKEDAANNVLTIYEMPAALFKRIPLDRILEINSQPAALPTQPNPTQPTRKEPLMPLITQVRNEILKELFQFHPDPIHRLNLMLKISGTRQQINKQLLEMKDRGWIAYDVVTGWSLTPAGYAVASDLLVFTCSVCHQIKKGKPAYQSPNMTICVPCFEGQKPADRLEHLLEKNPINQAKKFVD